MSETKDDTLPIEERDNCLARESSAGNTEVVQVLVTESDGLLLAKSVVEGKQGPRVMEFDEEATRLIHRQLDEHYEEEP